MANKQKPILTLDVSGYVVPVYYRPSTDFNTPTTMGSYSLVDMEISIVEKHPGGRVGELDTMFHEVTHCFSHINRIKLKEDQVWQLGTSYANLFYRNPEFCKYVQKACR